MSIESGVICWQRRPGKCVRFEISSYLKNVHTKIIFDQEHKLKNLAHLGEQTKKISWNLNVPVRQTEQK